MPSPAPSDDLIQLIEALPMGALTLDDSLRVTGYNLLFLDHFPVEGQWPPPSFDFARLKKMIEPLLDDSLENERSFLAQLERPNSAPLATEEPVFITQPLKTGKVLYVQWRVLPNDSHALFINAWGSGSSRQFFDMKGQISQSRGFLHALRENKQRLAMFMDSSSDFFALFDSELNVLDVDAKLVKMMGFEDKSQVVGLNALALSPEMEENGLYLLGQKVLQTGEPMEVEEVQVHPVLGERWMNMKVFKVGEGIGTISSDVTPRKEAELKLKNLNEELEKRVEGRTGELKAVHAQLVKKERLAMLGQLTATVSHELRNPLGTMRSSVFVLKSRMEGLKSGANETLDRIDRSITRCDRIIGELLDFTQIRGSEKTATHVDAWLRDLLEEQSTPPWLNREISLETEGLVLLMDSDHLRRVFINIYENSVQAMLPMYQNDPSLTLYLKIKSYLTDGFLCIALSDNGPGIQEALHEKVFEPLFSTKSFGVGLGLSIVKQIMEQEGGEVRITSGEEAGTTFTLKLPLNPEEISS